MKKIFKMFTIVSCVLLSVCMLTSCGKKNDKISVVATIFPQYDWARQVIGDDDSVELTLLTKNGADLHSYQPSVQDISKISTCDLFIYVGGESDEWVKEALKNATNKDMKVISMMDLLADVIKEEEVKEGMDGHDHDHDHEGEDHDHDHDHEHEEVEYDEHVWLSVKNAVRVTEAISKRLCEINKDHKQSYQENCTEYVNKLKALDEKYTEAVENATVKTILFADRFPFRYLVEDYKLDYFAAFVGCSAETEASFETIKFLAGKIDELNLKTILTIEGATHKIAETVKETTTTKDQVIRTLDSIQSVSMNDVNNGVNYLDIMENNLTVLKEALK